MGMHVVLAGTPVGGFQIIGPFKTAHFAQEWAQEWLDSLDWWVVPLSATEEFEK